ncbi:unnamed protein product [Boreogadus saida]
MCWSLPLGPLLYLPMAFSFSPQLKSFQKIFPEANTCNIVYRLPVHKDYGPYFNGLKRKWKAQSASSFVGGSTALSLFYRRINDTSAAAQVSKGLV